MATWQNPNVGKVLGYIYEYEKQPDTVLGGLPAYTLNKGSDSEQITLHPNTKPDFVEEGQGFKIFNPGSESQYAVPISKQPLEKFRSVEDVAGATKIPIYASPFTPSWQGRPMTPEEEFSNAAMIAGATDAPIQVSGVGTGVAQSHMFGADVRQAIGLPSSFDMLRGVDPTKPDWGAQNWSLWNPTSKGVIGDFIADAGPMLSIAMMLAGVPPIYAGAISGAANAAVNDGNILKGALTGAAVGAVGQGISQGLGSLANAAASTATEAAIDAGILGGSTVSMSSGIASLISDVSQFTGLPPSVIANAAKGAATSAITGGDPLQGAVAGAATAGVGQTVATSSLLEGLDDNLKRALTTAAQGATNAAVYGGDPLDAAINSITKSGLGVIEKEFKNAISAQPSAITSTQQLSEPTEQTAFAPSIDDILAAAQAGEAEQADLESFLRAQEPTALESLIDSGYLGQEPTQAQTFPVEMPETIPARPTYDTLEQLLADRGEPTLAAEPTAAEPDLGSDVARTFPIEMPEVIPTTPSYDTMEQLLADRGEPVVEEPVVPTVEEPTIDDVIAKLEEQQTERQTLANLFAPPSVAATSTENWIDSAGLVPSTPLEIEIAGTGGTETEYATPTESFIDTGGLTGGYPTTPTEDFIDAGGLTGGYPTTPTEDYIDRGGLGGGSGTTQTGGGGATGGGSTGTTGGQTTRPTTSRPQAAGPDLLSLMMMMGMMGGKQEQAPTPIPVVGQINPYQFSTDLLEGIYQKPKMAHGGSIDDLMRILRG